jgi:hypothetical protein
MIRGIQTASIGASALVSLALASASYAQCTIDPAPNYVQNDGGCPVTGVADTNGGCNVVPNAFQATGTISSATPSFTIGGTVGYDSVSGSRDLDWFTFTVTERCFVDFTVSMVHPDLTPSTAFQVFFGNPADCASFAGFQYAACPATFGEQACEPGTYAVVVTVPFAATEPCGTSYTINVTSRFSVYPECGAPGTGNCGIATPSVLGCDDFACCDKICTTDPLCCAIGWDTNCATLAQAPAAAGGCGIFVYSCNPVAGAPSNDCATAGQLVNLDTITAFDNTLASTDGPNTGQCGADTAKDVWFIVQAPADGNMTLTATSPTQDVVLSAYNLGTSASVDGAQLANNFIGCIDNLGIGGETGVLGGVQAGNYYLWRVGIWGNPTTPGIEGAAGAGNITIALERVVYDTGVHVAVCTSAGVATNLGLSSGAINATSPQRWLAVPFTVVDPDGAGPQTSWRLSLMQPEGFVPAGVVNEKLNWIIWSRNGFTPPNYLNDQVASGQLTFPAALGANGEADIPMDLVLEAGDYYLSVFASAVGNPCRPSDAQPTFSNFAWFVGAPNGIVPTNGGGVYYALRSAVQQGSGPADEVVIAGGTSPCEGNTAAAGFVNYTFAGAYTECAGGIPGSSLSPALHILGAPEAANACPTDLNGDGTTGSADLSILLNGWGGSSPDLNGDGLVGSADLSVLLNGWGACP